MSRFLIRWNTSATFRDNVAAYGGIAFAVLVLSLLGGCVRALPQEGDGEPVRIGGAPDLPMGMRVTRVLDKQTGVACYMTHDLRAISCVKVAGGSP